MKNKKHSFFKLALPQTCLICFNKDPILSNKTPLTFKKNVIEFKTDPIQFPIIETLFHSYLMPYSWVRKYNQEKPKKIKKERVITNNTYNRVKNSFYTYSSLPVNLSNNYKLPLKENNQFFIEGGRQPDLNIGTDTNYKIGSIYSKKELVASAEKSNLQAYRYFNDFKSHTVNQTKTELSRSITFFASAIGDNLTSLNNKSDKKKNKYLEPNTKDTIKNITNQQISTNNKETNYSIATSNISNIKNTIFANSKNFTNFVIDANNKSFSSSKSSSFEYFSDNANITKSQNMLDAVRSSHDANSFLTSSRVFGRQQTQTELTRASSFFAKSIGFSFSKLIHEKEKRSELDLVAKLIKQADVFEHRNATDDAVGLSKLTDLDELRSIVQDPNVINKSWLSESYKELQDQFFNLTRASQNKTNANSRTGSVNNEFETNKNYINNVGGTKNRSFEITTSNASNVSNTIFSNSRTHSNFAIGSELKNLKLKNLSRAFKKQSIKFLPEEEMKQAYSYLTNVKSFETSQTKTDLSRSISFFARSISNNLSCLVNDKPSNFMGLRALINTKIDNNHNAESRQSKLENKRNLDGELPGFVKLNRLKASINKALKGNRRDTINNIINQQTTDNTSETNYSIATSNISNIKNTIFANSKSLTNFAIDANNKSFSTGRASSFEYFSDNANISKSQNVLDAVRSSHDANSFLTSSSVFGRQQTQTELTRASSFFAKSIGYNFSKLMHEKDKRSELDGVAKLIKQAKAFEYKKANDDAVELSKLTDLDELRSIVQDPNMINKSWLSKSYKELQDQFFNLTRSNQNKTNANSQIQSVNNDFETNKNHISNVVGSKSRSFEINTNNASNVTNTIFSNAKTHTNFAIEGYLQNTKLKKSNQAFIKHPIKFTPEEGMKQAYSYLTNVKSFETSQTKTGLSRSIRFFASSTSNNLASLVKNKFPSFMGLKDLINTKTDNSHNAKSRQSKLENKQNMGGELSSFVKLNRLKANINKALKGNRRDTINNITNQQITTNNKETNYSIATSNISNIKNTIFANSKSLTNFAIDSNNKSFSTSRSSSLDFFSSDFNISKSQNMLDAVRSSQDANSFLTSSRVFGRQQTQTELTRASSFFAKSIGYNFSKLMSEKEKRSELDLVAKLIKQADAFEHKNTNDDAVELAKLTDLDELRSIVQDPNVINKSWLSKSYKELQDQFFNLTRSNQNKTNANSRIQSVNNDFETNKNHISNVVGSKNRSFEINTSNASNVASNINTTIFSNAKTHTNFAIEGGLQNTKLKKSNQAFIKQPIKFTPEEGMKQAYSYLTNVKSFETSQTKTDLSRSIRFFARSISNNLSSLLNDKSNKTQNNILNQNAKEQAGILNNKASQAFNDIYSSKQFQNYADEAKTTNIVLEKHPIENSVYNTNRSKLFQLFENKSNKSRYQNTNVNFNQFLHEANLIHNSLSNIKSSNIKKHNLEKKYYSSFLTQATKNEVRIVNEIKGMGELLGTELQYVGGKMKAFNQAIANQNSQIVTGINKLNLQSNQRVSPNRGHRSSIIDLPMSFKDPF